MTSDTSTDPGRATRAESAIARAALRAPTVYPGPVGVLISRELMAWARFGHRFGTDGLVSQLVEEILATTERSRD